MGAPKLETEDRPIPKESAYGINFGNESFAYIIVGPTEKNIGMAQLKIMSAGRGINQKPTIKLTFNDGTIVMCQCVNGLWDKKVAHDGTCKKDLFYEQGDGSFTSDALTLFPESPMTLVEVVCA